MRQVISGVDLMRCVGAPPWHALHESCARCSALTPPCRQRSQRRHPKYNKGLAFSDSERDRLYLRGLLPPVTLSQEVQLERTMLNIRSKSNDLEKYLYLQGLQVRSCRGAAGEALLLAGAAGDYSRGVGVPSRQGCPHS